MPNFSKPVVLLNFSKSNLLVSTITLLPFEAIALISGVHESFSGLTTLNLN